MALTARETCSSHVYDMKPTAQDPHPIPSPPRFSQLPPDGDEEVEVDLDLPLPNEDQELVLDRSTLPEGLSYLGDYPDLRSYLHAQLEPEVSEPCSWILDHLDYQAIQKRWETDGSRLICESGCIYRLAPLEPAPSQR